ncbi:hypothetical protein N9L02_02425 [Gammaproteobacteria bacterium]|nr:hypothetical protein [Gammaproteobacteria bacterium]
MMKSIIAILVLSIAVIMAMPYTYQGLDLLLSFHEQVSDALTEVFTGGNIGNIIRQLIALLTAPFLIGLIPSIVYWILKRSWFPYFMQLVWIVWLIQTSFVIIMTKI